MRLFIAVELDEAVRRAAARVGEELSRTLAGSGRVEVSWVRAENMHLTVRFLGETPHDRAGDLQARLSPPLETRPFDMRFAGVGTFPPRGPARVIWLGLSEGGDALAAIHGEVERRLEGLGFDREDRPFRAHLTLGRVRSRLAPRAMDAITSFRPGSVPPSAARELTLFESRLSPRGAVYTALLRTPLGEAGEEP